MKVSQYLFCTLLTSTYAFYSYFHGSGSAVKSTTATRQNLGVRMALKGLARKSKEAEVQKAKEILSRDDPQNIIFKYLKEGSEGLSSALRPTVLTASLKKMPGTLSVVAEYRRNLRSGFIANILEPELISPMFRDGGASAVAVATDSNYGGCNSEDVRKILKEQSIALGEFPSPLPVILRDLAVDPFQIATAKSLGVAGVTILLNLVGPEKASELVNFAGALDLESIVQVSTQEEIEQAIGIGATIIAITGKSPADACELKQSIPENILSVVHVDRRSDEGLEEIEDCWMLRDSGFQCIWASEILYKAGQLQSESIIAVIKAIRAKASVKYGRARGMSGKGEGAKEYLGTLAT